MLLIHKNLEYLPGRGKRKKKKQMQEMRTLSEKAVTTTNFIVLLSPNPVTPALKAATPCRHLGRMKDP